MRYVALGAVVIAGVDYDQASVKGLVIDLPSRRAKQTAPSRLYWQYGVTAVAAQGEVIVWGGSTCDDRPRADGAAYAGSWRTIARAPIAARSYHVAVWTGDEMIVWGGSRARGCSSTARRTTPHATAGTAYPRRRRRSAT